MATARTAIRKNNWVNIIFFVVTSLVGVIGTPFYIYEYGVSGPEIALFVFFLVVTPLGITVGYHRQFAHRTYKTNALIRFLLLFFGAASFQQSALEWSSQHRDHHRYVDTDQDPYSIKKGFFHAHIGWLMFWQFETDFDNVEGLAKDPLIRHQHRYYYPWAIVSGIVTPLLLGALTGHLLGALILSVCLRLTLVYHFTFFINSICHMFGRSTYDIYATAKDNWFISYLTFGEGYHNFHHRFSGDYRNGVRWYQWDPSKWLIWMLEKTGLAWDLRRISNFRILAAQLAGENRRVSDWLSRNGTNTELLKIDEAVQSQYNHLKENLSKWEEATREYKKILQHQVADYSKEVRESARWDLGEARQKFDHTHHDWKELLKHYPAVA